MSQPSAVQVRRLTKAFGARKVLAGLDLDLPAGQLTALLGPNGAGKTTLLRILATLARPTGGSIRLLGLDAAREAHLVRRRISLLSHRTLLYDDLTARQNLDFYARMYDVKDAEHRIGHLLEQVGLSHRAEDLVRTFSRGMQQRLALARALLHRPELLLLDEPYSGLDPVAADNLNRLLAEMQEHGCTVLLTTHDLNQGLALAGRVLVLARGKLVYDAPVAESPETFGTTYRRLTA